MEQLLFELKNKLKTIQGTGMSGHYGHLFMSCHEHHRYVAPVIIDSSVQAFQISITAF